VGLWAYAAFYDVGAGGGQFEPDVDETAETLIAAAGRVQEIYEREGCRPRVRESVDQIIDKMLCDGRAALQRRERWTCTAGDVELALYPVPDRVGPPSTAHPYGISEQEEP
jgi:hypothetical protein